jgi:hypothetical protein
MSDRFWIGQVVRPSGAVLTEVVSPEKYGPQLQFPDIRMGQDPILGETYGRWRLSDAEQWRVTWHWPNGPGNLPQFCDRTGEGSFASMNPADPPRGRDAVTERLKTLDAARSGATGTPRND